MQWYFAYGSNMNPARMQARGLSVVEALSGRLPGYGLCFNKRAMDRAPGRAYANIRHQRDAVVEGVLYRLQDADEIAKLDHFEGTPEAGAGEPVEPAADDDPVAESGRPLVIDLGAGEDKRKDKFIP